MCRLLTWFFGLSDSMLGTACKVRRTFMRMNCCFWVLERSQQNILQPNNMQPRFVEIFYYKFGDGIGEFYIICSVTCTCIHVSSIAFTKLNGTAINGRYTVDPLISRDLETGNQDAQISLGMRQD